MTSQVSMTVPMFRVRKVRDGAQRLTMVTAYDVAGGLPNALPAWLPDARVDVITQEFGTTSALRTLHAMINENHAWQAGLRAPTHPARQALLRAFHGVDDDAWQAKVVDAGLRVAASLPALLAR